MNIDLVKQQRQQCIKHPPSNEHPAACTTSSCSHNSLELCVCASGWLCTEHNESAPEKMMMSTRGIERGRIERGRKSHSRLEDCFWILARHDFVRRAGCSRPHPPRPFRHGLDRDFSVPTWHPYYSSWTCRPWRLLRALPRVAIIWGLKHYLLCTSCRPVTSASSALGQAFPALVTHPHSDRFPCSTYASCLLTLVEAW